jgi:hypothetical protein
LNVLKDKQRERENLRLDYDNHMKPESVPSSKEASIDKHGNAAKPLSFHPLTVDAALNRLLQVKPEPKPEK